MALVWVTGSSGTGKSTVCEVLRARGVLAVDADSAGYSRWVHRLSGEPMADSPHPLPPGWLEDFAWLIDPERVQALAADAQASVAYLFGSVENEVEVWDLFDHVVCLVADDDTLRHRLATRTTNDFGKDPDELQAILGWNKTVRDEYRRFGATIIDATQPLEVVVDHVLGAAAADA